jgi:hypothetical protein
LALDLPKCVHDIYLQTCSICRRLPPVANSTARRSGLATHSRANQSPLRLSDLAPDYAPWNSAVAEVFFSERSRDTPVYLDIGSETLARLASRVAPSAIDPRRDFIAAVKGTLSLRIREGLVFDAQQEFLRQWELGSRDEPPWCVGLLALFCLAAEEMVTDDRFRASNYYGRLCGVLGISDTQTCAKIHRDFQKQSHQFWSALNGWLEDSEYVHGRPTAFPFDYRTYVGIPISQALVKEHDRQRLHAFFHHYRLSPGQRLSLADVTRLLEEWLPTSPVSRALKHLWAQQDAKRQIAAIAKLELEAWTGAHQTAEGTGRREAPLVLVASLREHPVPRLDLALWVRNTESVPLGRYEIASDAPPAARAALQAVRGSIHLKQSPTEGWLEVAESFDVSMPDLLLTSLDLHSSAAAFSLRRPLRRMLLLKRDEATRAYVESPRAELSETYLLLSHRSLADDLAAFLSRTARAGFRRGDATAVRGLPHEWVAFWPVVIVAVEESRLPDLNTLTPVASTHMSLSGGFALPGRLTWHSAWPPEARVASLDEGALRLRLLHTQTLSGSAASEPRELGTLTAGAALVLRAAQPALEDGDYRLEAYGPEDGDAEPLTSVTFRLRSSDHPRPAMLGRVAAVRHCFASPGWAAISASSASDNETRATVTGIVVTRHDDTEHRQTNNGIPPPPDRLGGAGMTDAYTEADVPERVMRALSEAPPCLRGSHYFWIPAVIPGRRPPAEVQSRCLHCDFEKWFFRRAARARLFSSSQTERHSRPTTQVPAPLHTAGADRATLVWDDLLDALSYAQGGTWDTFLAIADQVDDSPWFAIEAARTLSALGHIDVALDMSTFRPQLWSASPPGLAVLEDGSEAVLCGRRSPRLLDVLRTQVDGMRGIVLTEPSQDGPTIIRIAMNAPRELDALVTDVSRALDHPFNIAHDVTRQIVSLLPRLTDVLQQTAEAAWPASQPECYDLISGSWRPTSAIDEPGAYRFPAQAWMYLYVTGPAVRRRIGHRCDARLVKHLAAADARRDLIAYNTRTRGLVVPLGAQLPGLFERVAVLCSGRPPSKHHDNTVTYTDVPPDIAGQLWQRLSRA